MWNHLSTEWELWETELIEAKKQVEIMGNQMRNLRDKFDKSIALYCLHIQIWRKHLTLNYTLYAKSIKNKQELNQCMNCNSLLKE